MRALKRAYGCLKTRAGQVLFAYHYTLYYTYIRVQHESYIHTYNIVRNTIICLLFFFFSLRSVKIQTSSTQYAPIRKYRYWSRRGLRITSAVTATIISSALLRVIMHLA